MIRIANLFLQKKKHKYLFILSPPFSGSTVMMRLIGSSSKTSVFSFEGQFLRRAKPLMRKDPWNPAQAIDWEKVRKIWRWKWDLRKSILVDKSPPNLLRASAMASAFIPSYFIVTIRNPYAFCEGFVRRGKGDYAQAIAQWLLCAEYQMKNVKTLEKVIFISYEVMTADPVGSIRNIQSLLPELVDIDPDTSFKLTILNEAREGKLRDNNEEKIKRIAKDDLAKVNQALLQKPDLLDFFGYSLLE